MNLKFLIFFISLQFFKLNLFAQNSDTTLLKFHIIFNAIPVSSPDQYFKLNTQDSIQFETFKFYISGVEFINNGKKVWQEENSFHLVDAFNAQTMNVVLRTPTKLLYNQVKFNLGIDSTTNYMGAMGGDLDPTKGMYWTWQNGYINFKLEGSSNLCNTDNNKFKFHIGGYQYPYNTLQSITLYVSNTAKIEINFDLNKLVTSILFSKTNLIVDPSSAAVSFSKKATEIFNIYDK